METLSESIRRAMGSNAPPAAHRGPTAKDIMVSDGLITLRADHTLRDAIKVMLQRRISGAPVVENDMHLIGILSEHDCLRVIAAGAYEGDPASGARTVGELMSKDVVTIEPDLNLYAVAHLFITRKLRRLPVVDRGRVVGQVSRRDVLKAVDKMLSP